MLAALPRGTSFLFVMSTKKKTSTGVRYTDAEKQEVVAFVAKYNTDNGRGGQSAAAKKFKVTPLTVAAWLKAAGKPAKNKAAAKPAKAAKAPAPVKGTRGGKGVASSKKGKRYTTEQKQEVIDFVNEHNAHNGRGGQSRAAAHFGLSVLTVSSWLKNPKMGGRGGAAAVPANLVSKVNELIELGGKINEAEAELKSLRARYERVKSSIQTSL
jgi:transposase-like protein